MRVCDRDEGVEARVGECCRETRVFEHSSELGQEERARPARSAVHDRGCDVVRFESDHERMRIEARVRQGSCSMRPEVDPKPACRSNGAGECGRASTLHRAERLDTEGQCGQTTKHDGGSERASGAVRGADEDDAETTLLCCRRSHVGARYPGIARRPRISLTMRA
jgi:hypothetical protein